MSLSRWERQSRYLLSRNSASWEGGWVLDRLSLGAKTSFHNFTILTMHEENRSEVSSNFWSRIEPSLHREPVGIPWLCQSRSILVNTELAWHNSNLQNMSISESTATATQDLPVSLAVWVYSGASAKELWDITLGTANWWGRVSAQREVQSFWYSKCSLSYQPNLA
jgi:hypothetical protein